SGSDSGSDTSSTTTTINPLALDIRSVASTPATDNVARGVLGSAASMMGDARSAVRDSAAAISSAHGRSSPFFSTYSLAEAVVSRIAPQAVAAVVAAAPVAAATAAVPTLMRWGSIDTLAAFS